MKCWGVNYCGQIGDGTTKERLTPVDVKGLTSGVVAIAAGYEHTCAVLSDGGVKCWGCNEYYRLGDGTWENENRYTPVDVSRLPRRAISVATGIWHSVALLSTGEVWWWGCDCPLAYRVPCNGEDPPFWNHYAIKKWVGRGVIEISADYYHTCLLYTDGGVKCWGYNEAGEIGDGVGVGKFTSELVEIRGLGGEVLKIDTGTKHSCALLVDRKMRCWGSNEYGQLGDGTREDSSIPVDVVGLEDKVLDMSVGGSHTCATLLNGKIKCWGSRTYGELGDGRASPPYILRPHKVYGTYE